MTSIVNGYLCMTSCDADVARRGIDPRNPHNDPVKAEELDAQRGKVDPSDRHGPAVVLGGALADAAVAGVAGASAGTAAPGRLADITV